MAHWLENAKKLLTIGWPLTGVLGLDTASGHRKQYEHSSGVAENWERWAEWIWWEKKEKEERKRKGRERETAPRKRVDNRKSMDFQPNTTHRDRASRAEHRDVNEREHRAVVNLRWTVSYRQETHGFLWEIFLTEALPAIWASNGIRTVMTPASAI